MKPQLTLAILAALGLAAVAIIPFASNQRAEARERTERARLIALAQQEQAEELQRQREFNKLLEPTPEELAEKARERAAAAKRQMIRERALEAATLATEVGVSEVKGLPILPDHKARLTELEAWFNANGQPEIATLITNRNGSRIQTLVTGY